MDIHSIRASLKAGFDFYERRPGHYQLIVPILHEDGDMVDIYLQDSAEREGYVRLCDFGMTLTRLSYTYEVNTDTRQRIFDSILINNGVHNDQGHLYLDTPVDRLQRVNRQRAPRVQGHLYLDTPVDRLYEGIFLKRKGARGLGPNNFKMAS